MDISLNLNDKCLNKALFNELKMTGITQGIGRICRPQYLAVVDGDNTLTIKR
ncbi:MAG: hypothetical protein GX813_00845 [Erysipelotrichia bacterium]|nr:hypothetical protein [Erysipelotrichia bacterium]